MINIYPLIESAIILSLILIALIAFSREYNRDNLIHMEILDDIDKLIKVRLNQYSFAIKISTENRNFFFV